MNDARKTVALAIAAGAGRLLDNGMASPEATIRELDGLRERFADVIDSDTETEIMAIRLRALEMQGHVTA